MLPTPPNESPLTTYYASPVGGTSRSYYIRYAVAPPALGSPEKQQR